MNAEDLIVRGFDRSRGRRDGSVCVACSQCAATVICGVPCHERGCPNETHECAECHARVNRNVRLCEGCQWDGSENDEGMAR